MKNINGSKLRMLTGEILAREGYHISDMPSTYNNTDILATNPSSGDKAAIFVNTTGRASMEKVTERDIRSSIPDNVDKLPEDSLLLIVSTKHSLTKSARQILSNIVIDKNVWYADILVEYLEKQNSTYLVDVYNEDKHRFDKEANLRDRLSYQDISVGDDVITYICNQTYHPRRLIAYLELSARGRSIDTFSTVAVRKFREDTKIDSYLSG
jgi:hypothetical protein